MLTPGSANWNGDTSTNPDRETAWADSKIGESESRSVTTSDEVVSRTMCRVLGKLAFSVMPLFPDRLVRVPGGGAATGSPSDAGNHGRADTLCPEAHDAGGDCGCTDLGHSVKTRSSGELTRVAERPSGASAWPPRCAANHGRGDPAVARRTGRRAAAATLRCG
jgi:hypothetical protein